jgi:membrane associated rhomboid family serine protease
MIPIRDTAPSRYPAIMMWVLIGINVVVFVFEASLGDTGIEQLFNRYGFVPAHLSVAPWSPMVWLSLFTSMFLHGGLMHLAGNMWSLWIFGDNIEDRMGPARFLVFYILCGLAAGLAHWVADPHSAIPTVGASGAISGVMGAYLVMFPRSRVVMLFPIFFLPYFFQIPAVVYLGFWFVAQIASGAAVLATESDAAGVAFWAHAGGFVAGIVLHRLFLWPKGAYRPFQPDEAQIDRAWMPLR